MTAKISQLVSKRDAMILSWKSRKDYKGYDRSKGSPFNSWRAIVYTAKGKAIGFPEEWRDYAAFMRDVAGDPATGKIVVRLNTSKPHGVGNSLWAEKGAEVACRLSELTYDGVTKTLVEWCGDLNLNYQGVRQRYFKGIGYSPQEILFGKPRKKRDKRESDHLTRTARMFGAYKLRDKKRGYTFDITLEFMRSEIAKGCAYCGDKENVGLDRIDNSIGHVMSNVVPCCYSCNCARNDNFSHDEMKHLGKVISEIKRKRNENGEKRAA
jgi:hypothetical protein